MLAPSWVPLLQHVASGIQNLVLAALPYLICLIGSTIELGQLRSSPFQLSGPKVATARGEQHLGPGPGPDGAGSWCLADAPKGLTRARPWHPAAGGRERAK